MSYVGFCEVAGKIAMQAVISESNDLKDVCVITKGVALSCGSTGLLLRTTDYGVTWEQPLTFTQYDFTTLVKGGANSVCVVSNGGFLLHSSNQGVNWSKTLSLTNMSVDFLVHDGKKYICFADSGRVIYESFTGGSWQKTQSKTPVKISSICISGNLFWFATLPKGGFILSTDEGLTWKIDSIKHEQSDKTIRYCTSISDDSLAVITAKKIYLFSYSANSWSSSSDTNSFLSKIYKNPLTKELFVLNTKVGILKVDKKLGRFAILELKKLTLPSVESLFESMAFFENGTSIIIGAKKCIWISNENGNSFSLRCVLPSAISNAICFSDSVITVGGNHGLMYRSIDAGTTFLPSTFATDVVSLVKTLHLVDSGNIYGINADITSAYMFSKDTGRTVSVIKGPFNYLSQKSRNRGNYIYRVMDLPLENGFGRNLFIGYDIWDNKIDTLFELLKFPKGVGLFEIQGDSTIYMQLLDIVDNKIKRTWLRSLNNGRNWDTLYLPDRSLEINSVFTWRENRVIALVKISAQDETYTVFISKDKGVTWSIIKNQTKVNKFTYDNTNSILYAMTEKGDSVYSSKNEGASWETIIVIPYGGYLPGWSLSVSVDRIWQHRNGLLNRSIDLENLNSINQDNQLPSYVMPFWLEKPYPNPTTTSLNIPFYCNKSVFPHGIQLKIFSPVGTLKEDLRQRVVSAKYDGTKAIVECDVSEYSSGLYYVVITSGNHRMVMPFAVIK